MKPEPYIAVIDFNMGNINSIVRRIFHLGYKYNVSSNTKEILGASKIILPGVGHFEKAVSNLKQLFLWDVLNEAVLIKKTPILGICLGMQLMAKHSEEGNIGGFGWFDANVVRFNVNDKLKYKVPHMGWNCINTMKQSKIMEGLPENPEFYFVHSYHAVSNNPYEVLAKTTYEYDFVTALEKDNIFGLQFHPEKSHDAGEKLLANFLKM